MYPSRPIIIPDPDLSAKSLEDLQYALKQMGKSKDSVVLCTFRHGHEGYVPPGTRTTYTRAKVEAELARRSEVSATIPPPPPVYYRVMETDEGISVVTMQDFDERDYDQSLFMTDTRFTSEASAWEWVREQDTGGKRVLSNPTTVQALGRVTDGADERDLTPLKLTAWGASYPHPTVVKALAWLVSMQVTLPTSMADRAQRRLLDELSELAGIVGGSDAT